MTTRNVPGWIGRFLLVNGLLASPALAPAMSTQFQQAVLTSGPILYYQLGETSGNAVDHGSSGAALNAVYNGTPIRGIATREGDAGVAFTGVNDYLESQGPSPASLTGNPSFTIETVVYLPSNGTVVDYPPFLHWGAGSTAQEVYFAPHF